ncbi:hypothetical protein S40285_07799 [Stachybotrys chlorohalonatus IBT 40285]|uniref:ADF-H domain-containing protein n=1 Tax=Stachybotrys chlorohalonatus (strain IBT 40285) TaxID=1283841 RepID=A0A084QDD3_STAC4|nr:hypothetical protein S40285_07799 [Stachybotrys chlorohalonata IBT 40285]
MSLNGLDAPQIKEAHDAVAAEPGGWFLLKYASRDEIELLSRGNGGIVEVRKAIAEYDESSPLYGFLKYRRRNVIIKYLPEDCSRLIQARVAVHFNAVCDRFSPHDTAFEISQADQLKDTRLSAACSLHAATGSSSSSTSSLRRRRLMEIAEEDEEEPRAAKRKSTVLEDNDAVKEPEEPAEPVTLNSELAISPDQSKFSADTTSEIPNFVGVDDAQTSSIEAARRSSSQSARPDLYGYSSYPYAKPKVKLAPRPSLDVISRPQTAGNFRPVSAIPAGFKMFGKSGQKKPKNKEDGDSAAASVEAEFASPPLATLEELPPPSTDIPRPSTSSGVSTKSTIMPVQSTKPSITPEKARLMKAMQLREKKKKKLSAEAAAAAADQAVKSEHGITEAESLGRTEHDLESIEENSQLNTETGSEDKPLDAPEDAGESPRTNGKRITMIHADSGVILESVPSDHADQASEQTHSDSRPQSPAVTSELETSTKASSLSGSTDETMQALHEEASENKDAKNSPAKEPPATVPRASATNDASSTEAPSSDDTVSINHTEPQQQLEILQPAAPRHHDAEPANEASHTPSEESSDAKVQNDGKDELQPSPASVAEPAGVPQFAGHDTTDNEATNDVSVNGSNPATAAVVSEALESTPGDKSELSESGIADLPTKPGPNQPGVSVPLIQTPDDSYDGLAVDINATDDKSNDADDDDDISTAPTTGPPLLKQHRPAGMTIRTDLAQAHSRNVSQSLSEAHLSDDEDLMEELQSATVQEATSMTVAKTPLTPVFPMSAKGPVASTAGSPHIVRTVSNPIRGNFIPPGDINQSSARSVSSSGAAFLHKVTQHQPGGNLSKKAVGSSISQRIKALEMLSANTGESLASPTGRERPSSTFFAVRKEREPSRSPSVVDRAYSFSKNTPPPPSTAVSRDPSPGETKERKRDRSRSVASRLSMFESTPPHNSIAASPSPPQRPRGRPESISVAARIVKDPEQSMLKILEPPKDLSEYQHLDLKQSPLVVDHQRAIPAQQAPAVEESMPERRMSRESRRSESQDFGKDGKGRRSSFTKIREFMKDRRKSVTSTNGEVVPVPPAGNASRSPTRPPSSHQNGSSFAQRLSISSRRSLSKDRDMNLSPGAYTESSLSSDEAKSTGSEKMKSRAGRFMRRLSTLSGSGGRNKMSSPPVLSPTLPEEDVLPEPAVVPRPSTTNTPAIVSDMGDVNVQFPDNLLWKRRNMCIDAQGFLILSALPAQLGRPAQGTKRYHLSEFRQPYIPDVEIQELPNSVVLDLIEGSGVQLACEDRAGQARVLEALCDAHASHATAFGR